MKVETINDQSVHDEGHKLKDQEGRDGTEIDKKHA